MTENGQLDMDALNRCVQEAALQLTGDLIDALYPPRKKLPRVEANCTSCGLPCKGWRNPDGTVLYERCGVCEILKEDWRDGVCRCEGEE